MFLLDSRLGYSTNSEAKCLYSLLLLIIYSLNANAKYFDL
jgi:hypothetical protein